MDYKISKQDIIDYLSRSKSSIEYQETINKFIHKLAAESIEWFNDVENKNKWKLSDENGFFQSIYYFKNPKI